MADRENTQLAQLIDVAIELGNEQDLKAATAFLIGAGVGFATTVRVLSEPKRRRLRASNSAIQPSVLSGKRIILVQN